MGGYDLPISIFGLQEPGVSMAVVVSPCLYPPGTDLDDPMYYTALILRGPEENYVAWLWSFLPVSPYFHKVLAAQRGVHARPRMGAEKCPAMPRFILAEPGQETSRVHVRDFLGLHQQLFNPQGLEPYQLLPRRRLFC